MKQAIHIEKYNKNLPKYFAKEKALLAKIFGKFRIEHIGSSAVAGLGGKNVIDIQLLVPDKKTAGKTIEKIEALGYKHCKDSGNRYRLFFLKFRLFGKKKIRIHLHLMWKTANEYKKHLVFRDYLRKHPEEANTYYLLKEKWANLAGNSRKKYVKLKTDYIKSVLKKARKPMKKAK